MPAILDSLFYKVVNTMRGVVRSHKVAGTSDTKIVLWPNSFNSGCFQLHMSQNVATFMLSLTSQSCSDSLLAVSLARQGGAIYRLPKHPWTPDRPVTEAQYKQTIEASPMVKAWTIDLLLYLSNDHEKWDLKLYMYKDPFWQIW